MDEAWHDLMHAAQSEIEAAPVSVSATLEEPTGAETKCWFMRIWRFWQNVKGHSSLQRARLYIKDAICYRFRHLITVWNIRNHDYPQIFSTVLQDEQVRNVLENAVYYELQTVRSSDENLCPAIIQKYKMLAVSVLNNMYSTLSDTYVRLITWMLYKILPWFLSGLTVHSSQLQELKHFSKTNLPLVFLPLHRSYLDHVIISFVLAINGIRCPLAALGDELHFPIIGPLMRAYGGFHVKYFKNISNSADEQLYKSILHAYVVENLRAGHSLELFVEGRRTKTGKPLIPKGGLVSVVMAAFVDGMIEDAVIIPVNVNYEKLPDGNFVSELLGQSEKVPTLGGILTNVLNCLFTNFGMISIHFQRPIILSETLEEIHKASKLISQSEAVLSGYSVKPDGENSGRSLASKASNTSLSGLDILEDVDEKIVTSFVRSILFELSKRTTVMSTNAVAFLLLNHFPHGATMCQLVDALHKLRTEFSANVGVLGFSDSNVDVINHAINILGPGMVKREIRCVPVEGKAEPEHPVFFQPVTYLPNVLELAYYSNTILPFFLIEAILARVTYSVQKWEEKATEKIPQQTLAIDDEMIVAFACELCEILQYEFIFESSDSKLENTLSVKLESLKNKGILKASDDEESTKLDEFLKFYVPLLQPFIDVYAVSARILDRLVDTQILEDDLYKDILWEIKVQIDIGNIKYEQSLSTDIIKNSLKLFTKWGILDFHVQDNIRLYYLNEGKNIERLLQKIQKKIDKYL